jgi:CHASE3 domain sensor protein
MSRFFQDPGMARAPIASRSTLSFGFVASVLILVLLGAFSYWVLHDISSSCMAEAERVYGNYGYAPREGSR